MARRYFYQNVGRAILTPANASVSLTGVAATAAVGVISIGISITLTGVAGTGAVGVITPFTGTQVSLTGVSATASVGILTASVETPSFNPRYTLTNPVTRVRTLRNMPT